MAVALFADVDLGLRLILTGYITYYVVKYRNWLVGAVIGDSLISLYIYLKFHDIASAQIFGEPSVFILVYIIIKYMQYQYAGTLPGQANFKEQSQHKVTFLETEFDKDIQGRITSWPESAQNFYGYSKAEAIGKDVSLLIPPEIGPERDEIMQELEAGHDIINYHTKRRKKDGTTIPVILTIRGIKNVTGEVVGAHISARLED